MANDNDAQGVRELYPAERVVFWRHMGFRLFVGSWALYSIVFDPFDKAFVTLIVLLCFKGMGETVFVSLMGLARLRAQRDEELQRQEKIRQAKAAKAAAQAEAQAVAAAAYFDLGPAGSAAPKTAIAK